MEGLSAYILSLRWSTNSGSEKLDKETVMSIIRFTFAMFGLAFVIVGCAAERPQSTVSRGLESGITSNNGGGMAPANFGTTAPVKAQ